MGREDILSDMIEVEPLDKDEFLKVRETLTRIGFKFVDKEGGKPKLVQQCHVLHSGGRYFICHFKQLFLLDGRSKSTNYTEFDDGVLLKTVNLLEGWGLIKPFDEIEKVDVHVLAIPFKQKDEYILKSNYKLGKENVRYQKESQKGQ